MVWLLLEAEAETAVALPRRPEAGNLYECQREIPGTAVRGAFAARFLDRKGFVSRDLFDTPAVRFGPLRPLPNAEGLPVPTPCCVVPVPRSARSCKYDDGFEGAGHGVWDILLQVAAKHRPPEAPMCPKCGAPLEPLERAWLVMDWAKGQGFAYDPVFQLSTHVGIGEEGIAEEGRLFSLQHFPAGTRFVGWIAADVSMGGADLLKELGFVETSNGEWVTTLRVGRRSRSLGAVTVKANVLANPPWQCSHGSLEKRWQRFQQHTGSLKEALQKVLREEKGEMDDFYLLSVTCLTDTVLLDDSLRPYRIIPAAYLAQRLGLDGGSVVGPLAPFTRTGVAGGWHNAHRLPKLPDGTIVAGSVFLFAFAVDKSKVTNEQEILQRLRKLEETGIGWRRSEGLGQILFCDPFHLVDDKGQVPLRTEKRSPDNAREELAMLCVDDPMRKFLRQNADVFWNNPPLSRSQLTGFREFVNRLNARPEEAIKTLNERLKHLKERSKPSESWRATVKVDNQQKELVDALQEVLIRGDAKWELIHQRALFFVTLVLLARDAQEKKVGLDQGKKVGLEKGAWLELVKGA